MIAENMKKTVLSFVFLFTFTFCAYAQKSDYSSYEPELLSDSINHVYQISRGDKINIPGFYFDSGSYSLNKNLKEYIKNISEELLKIKYSSVIIKAYTDSSGSAELNKTLSRKRAKAISDEFIKNGIPPKRITYYGLGSQNPVADNKTKNGRVQNRRVEITVQ
jgi:Outer membrane protein and related peptidoglycan-associated (lipo)proteins